MTKIRIAPFLIILSIAAAIFSWSHFSYPKFVGIDLSIDRNRAREIAKDYLTDKEGMDVSSYLSAVIFNEDSMVTRYLQKAIGFAAQEKFIQTHQYDLFVWTLRFFNESQKEEFRINISSKTGEVLSFNHVLDDSAVRPFINEEEAQEKAQQFLMRQFNFDLSNYTFYSKTSRKFDHRVEYTFYWEKKDVYVPWDVDPQLSGGGRLLSNVTVSGDDILSFNKQIFSAPDQFLRHVERLKESGRNLGLVSQIGTLFFFVGAIWIMVIRRNHLAMNVTKLFYTRVVIILFLLSLLSGFNNVQGVMFQYPTTQPLQSYLIRQMIYEVLDRFFFYICFLLPCLAGELLRFEVFPRRREAGMFHYLTTTFFSRQTAKSVLYGYCFAVIMLGFQSIIFQWGHRYFDVWVEYTRLNQFSTAYFPFIGVLIMAANASFTEESFYRLFGISFGVKMFRNLTLAVIISSVIWGLGHTGYMVFPYWFRGVEVTLLGLLTAFVYLRYGFICVLVEHFLFNVFWISSPYLFGRSSQLDFLTSLGILILPAVFAIIAAVINRPVIITKTEWRLNIQQKFNLEILKIYILSQSLAPGFSPDALRKQLISHDWDIAIIDVAFNQLNLRLSSENASSDA